MRIRPLLAIMIAMFGMAWSVAGTTVPEVTVYKTTECYCCARWVDHLRDAGFVVTVANVSNIEDVKSKFAIPDALRSCHTAKIEGYVLEGHVPATDVRRLVSERPAVVGLAVPGMPVGSPGMEVPGVAQQPYDVLAFDASGTTKIFASHSR